MLVSFMRTKNEAVSLVVNDTAPHCLLITLTEFQKLVQ